MAGKGRSKFLETKYFGLVLGLLVFLLTFLVSQSTLLIDNLEFKVLDFNFRLKNTIRAQRIQGRGDDPRAEP